MSGEELIARLEKLSGPDREVDALIFCALHGYSFVRYERWNASAGRLYYTIHAAGVDISAESSGCPCYTGSIDKALLAKPADWSWRVGNLPSGRGFAELGTQKSLQCVEGATPAIALCIAALGCRASKDGGVDAR